METIFISHAAPADNEITRWLALRLMREGYSVWCDLERLRVGDDFWREIENEIRGKAAKFLLVLTKTSKDRDGVLKELGVAAKIAKHRGKRFILPIRADDLSFDDFPIEANRLDAADFSQSWSDGLARLLQILDEDKLPKKSDGPAAAAAWWKNRYNINEAVKEQKEEYLTNCFKILSPPKKVYLHALNDLKPFDGEKFKPAFPVHQYGGLSFHLPMPKICERHFPLPKQRSEIHSRLT